ncbi:hypothetical protein PSPO01_09348 [Paraphaeosphaeria sporulosa]
MDTAASSEHDNGQAAVWSDPGPRVGRPGRAEQRRPLLAFDMWRRAAQGPTRDWLRPAPCPLPAVVAFLISSVPHRLSKIPPPKLPPHLRLALLVRPSWQSHRWAPQARSHRLLARRSRHGPLAGAIGHLAVAGAP